MILDLYLSVELIVPVVILGLILVVLGKETLEVLSFAIGAMAGGIIAYMIFNGFLYLNPVPLYVKAPIAALMILGGGLLGRGAMATFIAMLASLVVADVFYAITGDGLLLISIAVSMIAFAVFVALVQKHLIIFSAFIGGSLVSIPLNLLPIDDVVSVRIMQLALSLVLCAVGAYLQHRVKKWKDTRGENIVWVPG